MRTAKLKEWIGKTDDAMPPQTVRDRLSRNQGDRCAGCGTAFGPGMRANCDHVIPLRDGGENRESNMQMLCNWCHVTKTSAENTSRAKTNRIRAKHLGLDNAKSNMPRRGFRKSAPQKRATTPSPPKFEGDIRARKESQT